MTTSRFTCLADLDDATLARVLDRARQLEADPRRRDLEGRVLGLLFLNPSLRTLASMQAGMAQLGGSSVVLVPGQGTWGLETRLGVRMDGAEAEHVREAIPVLEEYVDALGVRAFGAGATVEEDLAEPVLGAMAAVASGPFMSLESAMDHPCQALGDWKTLDDLEVPASGKLVLSWAWHPRPLPLAVPTAVLRMAARRGMEVTVLAPPAFQLPASVLPAGSRVHQTEDREAAMDGARVLYAKSWRCPDRYGDPAGDAAARAGLEGWCVGEDWFAPARPEAVFMHCLPVRRNVVVRDEVLEGPRSRVVRQAGNRLHVQKSVLLELLGS